MSCNKYDKNVVFTWVNVHPPSTVHRANTINLLQTAVEDHLDEVNPWVSSTQSLTGPPAHRGERSATPEDGTSWLRWSGRGSSPPESDIHRTPSQTGRTAWPPDRFKHNIIHITHKLWFHCTSFCIWSAVKMWLPDRPQSRSDVWGFSWSSSVSCCSWMNPGESAHPWYEGSRAPDRC